MFSHIMGLKHRQEFIERRYPDGNHIHLNQVNSNKQVLAY
jgi:hypothetical protein